MKKLRHLCGGLSLLAPLAALGCGDSVRCIDAPGQAITCEAEGAELVDEDGADDAPLEERLERLESDLSIGARGAEVRALNEYLSQYGYYPNTELAESYPHWRPAVAEAPGDLAVYDDTTARAVSRLQHNFGLAVTGSVDEATRVVLRTERCALPDGISFPSHDPTEKFALFSQKLTDTTLTWRVMDVAGMNDSNLLPAAPAGCAPSACTTHRLNLIRTAFSGAFESWERATGVDFTQITSGTPDIAIVFVALDPGFMAAPLPGPTGIKTIKVDNTVDWSVQGSGVAIPGRYDVETTALHEIGHLLGLLHSTVNGASTSGPDSRGASMTSALPTGVLDRILHPDDNVAGSLRYESWINLPTVTGTGAQIGPARDIAVNAGLAWMVGQTAVPSGGFTIHRATSTFPAGTWSAHVSGNIGARRLAVDAAGRPWIISGNQQVFQRSSTSATSGTWDLRGTPSNCLTDIGVGGFDKAWGLGCSLDSNGDFRIFRWTGSAWEQPDPNARGVRITVDGSGAPWIVNSANQIWRRPVATGVWVQVGGSAIDIGAGPAATATVNGVSTSIGYVYVTGPDQSIWGWNEQPTDPVDTCDPEPGEVCPVPNFSPAANTFQLSTLGAAIRIAVNFEGSPWVIAGDGSLWYQKM